MSTEPINQFITDYSAILIVIVIFFTPVMGYALSRYLESKDTATNKRIRQQRESVKEMSIY